MNNTGVYLVFAAKFDPTTNLNLARIVSLEKDSMERWLNKVAVVSGASSGIGAVIAADLVKNGFIVVALARRMDRLHEKQLALSEDLRLRYYPRKCDVTNEAEVKNTFAWIEANLGGTDVLVNNAGIAAKGPLLTSEHDTESFRNVVDTNIMSVVYCVREAFHSMKKRNFDGHVVIINSVLGHSVPMRLAEDMNIYPATKHAVTAMVEIYRQAFSRTGTKVKVTVS